MASTNDDLPVIPAARADDLHNIEFVNNVDLVLFMAGNQFMVMDELITSFQDRHPEVEKIFYETLPPGLELRQIIAGGARFRNTVIDVMPDVYTSVTGEAMEELCAKGIVEDYSVYLHNRIVLMVREGNPLGIKSVHDLFRDDIRISQPGSMEDISHYITGMYRDAGGESLVNRILEEKRAEGTTVFTAVHHRETPLRLQKGTVDAGPVWATEVINAKNEGMKVESVEPGDLLDQRGNVSYYISKLLYSPNPENADKFLAFIKSGQAQEIYSRYGFVPHYT